MVFVKRQTRKRARDGWGTIRFCLTPTRNGCKGETSLNNQNFHRSTRMDTTIKASELKESIMNIPDDADVSFGPASGMNPGSLTIYRVHRLDDDLFNIEFNEVFQVLIDP